MSLRTFPPSQMVSTSSVSDERTPLMRSASAMNSQSSGHCQQSPVEMHLPSQSFRCRMICIILIVILERITFYGLIANLLPFLINRIGLDQSASIAVVFTFTGLAWLMSTIGGIIADSYSGRYNAVYGSLLIYIVGVGMVLAAAVFSELKLRESFYQPLTFVALIIISVGEGAYKANVTAFGGDQLQAGDDTEYRRFFNWYYWSINIAVFIAFTAIAFVEQNESFGFSKGFGILFGCIILACITLCVQRSIYVCHPPTGHIVRKVYNIIKEARRRKREQSAWYELVPNFTDVMSNLTIQASRVSVSLVGRCALWDSK